MYTVQTGYAAADCEYININTYTSHNYCEQFTYWTLTKHMKIFIYVCIYACIWLFIPVYNFILAWLQATTGTLYLSMFMAVTVMNKCQQHLSVKI